MRYRESTVLTFSNRTGSDQRTAIRVLESELFEKCYMYIMGSVWQAIKVKVLTCSQLIKLSSLLFLVCIHFQSASILLKIDYNVGVSNNLDQGETPIYWPGSNLFT